MDVDVRLVDREYVVDAVVKEEAVVRHENIALLAFQIVGDASSAFKI